MDIDDARVVIQDLPYGVKGFVLIDAEGFATIVINAHYSRSTQRVALKHELRHLSRDDAYNDSPIRVVESA